MTALALALALAFLGSVASTSVRAGSPAQLGQFEIIDPGLEITPIHAALLRTGKVWLASGSANSERLHNEGVFRTYVWNPEDGSLSKQSAPWDLFCAGHTFLANGRLLIAGGVRAYPQEPPGPRQFAGTRLAYTFDPITETYKRMPSMAGGRWYPTLVTLGNGAVYATAGIDETATAMNDVPEVLKPGRSSWVARPSTGPWPMYPHLFLTKGGRLFYSGGNVFPGMFGIELPPPGFLKTATSTLTPVSGLSQPDSRDQSASVLLPPAQTQKVMIMGGGAPTSSDGTLDNVDIIDLKGANPHYVAGPAMLHPRMHLNAVLLPDRTVLVTGGASGREMDPVYQSEIYNPRTNTWSAAATSEVGRMYHSFALLLPDGRVLLGGSQPDGMPAERRLEIYSPPYMFKGTRPVITEAPNVVAYGTTVRIRTTQANNIKWVSLIRPSAVTHSVDTEQRVVHVPARHVAPATLKLTFPTDRTIAPPGWYMLFVTNDSGVPSQAAWIRLG